MSRRHYPPAYLRYLKARLRNLGHPGFWGTAIFLSIVGLATWEYWSKPDVFTRQQQNPVASQQAAVSSLSAEDRAILADIDNLPVLFNDLEQGNLSVIANTPKENTSEKSKDIDEEQSTASEAKSNLGLSVANNTSSPIVKNPFVAQAENLLYAGTIDSSNQFLGVKPLNGRLEQTGAVSTLSSLGVGLDNQTKKNQNSVPISPLQAALNQSTNQKLSSFNGGTSPQTNSLGRVSDSQASLTLPTNSLPNQTFLPNNGAGYMQTGTNLLQNSYSNLNSGQPLPNVAPTIPVMPPVTSSTPTNISPYANQISTQSITNSTTPVGSANYGIQQPTQLPQSAYGNYGLQQQPTKVPQSNFSYPRQIQRQYTGGNQR